MEMKMPGLSSISHYYSLGVHLLPLGLCLLGTTIQLSGCGDDAGESRNYLEEQKAEKKAVIAEIKTKKKYIWEQGAYPAKGLLIVDYGDFEFRVPTSYVGQNSTNSLFFDMLIQWPSKCTKDEVCQKARLPEDIVYIAVDPRVKGGDGFLGLDTYIHRGAMKGPVKSDRYSGLTKYYGTNDIYVSSGSKIKTPNGNPILITCDQIRSSLDRENRRCSERFKYRNDLGIKVEFYSDNLKDWKEIHNTVLSLLDRFTEDKK